MEPLPSLRTLSPSPSTVSPYNKGKYVPTKVRFNEELDKEDDIQGQRKIKGDIYSKEKLRSKRATSLERVCRGESPIDDIDTITPEPAVKAKTKKVSQKTIKEKKPP
jgi:hypothetical protein